MPSSSSKHGTLSFVSAGSTEPSLRRNGKLGTRRGLDGDDDARFGFSPVDMEIEILNAREEGPTFLRNGFELHTLSQRDMTADLAVSTDTTSDFLAGKTNTTLDLAGTDMYDAHNIVHTYYPVVEEIAKNVVLKEMQEMQEMQERKENSQEGEARKRARKEQGKEWRSKIHAFPFDHNIRHRQKKGKESQEEKDYKIKTGGQNTQNVQKGLPFVHTDYTLTSAPRRLRDLMTKPPTQNDTWRDYNLVEGETEKENNTENTGNTGKQKSTNQFFRNSPEEPRIPEVLFKEKKIGRWLMLNVWRNLDVKSPIKQFPLAMCDYSTTDPKDMAVFEVHYTERIGENYFGIGEDKDKKQKWYQYPEMTHQECIVMKQWDSEGTLHQKHNLSQQQETDDIIFNLPTSSSESPPVINSSGVPDFTLHASPDLHEEADLPMRRSLEVRCFVLIEV